MDRLELEEKNGCVEYYDYVTLYDGPTDASSVLKQYCSPDTSTVTSSGSAMLVVFSSDESVHDGGFSLSWTFVSQADGTGAQGVLSSLYRQQAFTADVQAALFVIGPT